MTLFEWLVTIGIAVGAREVVGTVLRELAKDLYGAARDEVKERRRKRKRKPPRKGGGIGMW